MSQRVAFPRMSGDERRRELLQCLVHPNEPTSRETNRLGNGHSCLSNDDLAALHARRTAADVTVMRDPSR